MRNSANSPAEKGSSENLRQFGHKLLDDQTKTNDRLKEIAAKANIAIPDSLDSKHQTQIDKIAKLSGPEFDKAFLKQQVKEQETQARLQRRGAARHRSERQDLCRRHAAQSAAATRGGQGPE